MWQREGILEEKNPESCFEEIWSISWGKVEKSEKLWSREKRNQDLNNEILKLTELYGIKELSLLCIAQRKPYMEETLR